MTGRLVSGLLAILVLAGAYFLALDLAKSARFAQGSGGKEIDTGPQVVLRGVEMTEEHRGGTVYRLVSDEATYSVLSERVVASGVTLALPDRGGNVVVTAPVATWNMEEGRIDLPQGADARNEGGWAASAPGARLDLKSGEITAGEARLSGPGVTVSGRNLRWSWHDGAVVLDSPRSTVYPGTIRAPERNG